MSQSKIVLAVDFGTSNSLVGGGSESEVFAPIALDPAAKDPRVMRSVICFQPGTQPSFGIQGIKDYSGNIGSARLIRSFKRFLPAKAFRGTLIGNRLWKLEELIALFLRQLRDAANTHFNQEIRSVVLGRPAIFSDDPVADQLASSRLAQAARLAGFETVEFVAEPIAAAYRYRLELEKQEIVLIGDFGGGTSDFTIIRLSRAPFKPSDVLSIGGTPTAGDALDGAIMRHRIVSNFGANVVYRTPFGENVLTMPKGFISHLCSNAQIQLLLSRENMEFIRKIRSWSLGPEDQAVLDQLKVLVEDGLGFPIFEAIELAKRQLSDRESGDVIFNYPGICVNEMLTRKQLIDYSKTDVERIFKALDDTVQRAGLPFDQIDRVVCTGGTAKALVIRQEMGRRFGIEKLKSFRNFSSIVEGLSERAHELAQS